MGENVCTYSRRGVLEISGLETNLNPVCVYVTPDNLGVYRRDGGEVVRLHHCDEL